MFEKQSSRRGKTKIDKFHLPLHKYVKCELSCYFYSLPSIENPFILEFQSKVTRFNQFGIKQKFRTVRCTCNRNRIRKWLKNKTEKYYDKIKKSMEGYKKKKLLAKIIRYTDLRYMNFVLDVNIENLKSTWEANSEKKYHRRIKLREEDGRWNHVWM